MINNNTCQANNGDAYNDQAKLDAYQGVDIESHEIVLDDEIVEDDDDDIDCYHRMKDPLPLQGPISSHHHSCGCGKDHTTTSSGKAFVGTIDHLPEHLRDNKHLLTGYRINHNSTADVIRSLFYAHNELVNVWSHLLSAFVVIVILIIMIVVYPSLCTSSYNGWMNEFKYMNSFSGSNSVITMPQFTTLKLQNFES